ncbi:unnamed protein product [Rotaria magnacalcarata]
MNEFLTATIKLFNNCFGALLASTGLLLRTKLAVLKCVPKMWEVLKSCCFWKNQLSWYFFCFAEKVLQLHWW